jgi:hypothetical protein
MAMSLASHAASRKRIKRRLCGVPFEECQGEAVKLSPGLSSGLKCHATPEDAFECHRVWLLRQGYKQVGGREFESPHNGRIVVLTKKRRFGAILRGGKEGRHMLSHFLGGCLIG